MVRRYTPPALCAQSTLQSLTDKINKETSSILNEVYLNRGLFEFLFSIPMFVDYSNRKTVFVCVLASRVYNYS